MRLAAFLADHIPMSSLRSAVRARLNRFIAGALAAILSGCSGVPVISNSYYDITYRSGEWGGNELPVVVRGAPFAVPQAEFAAAVVAAMQGTTSGVPTRFVPAAASDPAPAYRVVMVFNPPPGLGYNIACLRPMPPDAVFGSAPAASVQVLAAFCRGDRAVTSAEGWVPTGGDPREPLFQHGVSAFGLQLFPLINPSDKGGIEFSS